MHPRGPSTALFLAMIVLIAGLLAGCGGGDQSGNGSQQGGGSQAKQGENVPENQRGSNTPKKKILFANKFKITLGGQEAKPDDMKKGQQAQVEYIVRNDRNRALNVRLFEGGGGSPGEQGAEKTG